MSRPAPFRACDIRRAVRAYAKGAGVPADTVAVEIKADGAIVVRAAGNDPFTDEATLDRGLREIIKGQKVLHSPVTD